MANLSDRKQNNCPQCGRTHLLNHSWKQCACSAFLRLPENAPDQVEVGILDGNQIISNGVFLPGSPQAGTSGLSNRALGLGMLLFMALFIIVIMLLSTCATGSPPPPPPSSYIPL